MPDENAKIILAANHSKLTKVRDAFVTEGSVNALKCQFQFRTLDWDNTMKTAMFVSGQATPSTPDDAIKPMILDENDECDVPFEVLTNGTFSVGVFGIAEKYRIVSNWMYYKVIDGCFAEGSTSLEPTPTVYEQILTTVKDHTHDEYITNEAAETMIGDNISQVIDEMFGADALDAGLVTDY